MQGRRLSMRRGRSGNLDAAAIDSGAFYPSEAKAFRSRDRSRRQEQGLPAAAVADCRGRRLSGAHTRRRAASCWTDPLLLPGKCRAPQARC